MNNEEIGYIKAKVESLYDKVEEYRQGDIDAHKSIEQSLRDIRDQLSLYKHLVLFVKALGLTLLFIIAFKFGDIKELWSTLGK